jgi:dinuclear metal center YbgI/SA1388 family protein
MTLIQDICDFLERLCPPVLAEAWDNVGLLLGDPAATATGVMTCLTATEETVREAVAQRASLVISHHPLPFRPLKTLTTRTPEGRCLWELARAGIALYSPHTTYDSAALGINQQLAEGLGLTHIAPLAVPEGAPEGSGTGRAGAAPAGSTLGVIAKAARQLLGVDAVQLVGDAHRKIRRVGVACGSAGDLHEAARTAQCDCLVTGEARFHACLEAQATGLSLILVGHYASERRGVEQLARFVQQQFNNLTVWASRDERDPLKWHGWTDANALPSNEKT